MEWNISLLSIYTAEPFHSFPWPFASHFRCGRKAPMIWYESAVSRTKRSSLSKEFSRGTSHGGKGTFRGDRILCLFGSLLFSARCVPDVESCSFSRQSYLTLLRRSQSHITINHADKPCTIYHSSPTPSFSFVGYDTIRYDTARRKNETEN